MRILTNLLVIVGVTILGSQSSRAELMESFVKKAFSWPIPDERPHLMLSRGVVLAWLKDPSTFLPVDHEQGYYESGNRSMVIVPPGMFFIAFPPRTKAHRNIGGRLTDTKFQLAVTRDGLWGIVNISPKGLFLDEPDLVKISVEEKDGEEFPKFGMLKSSYFEAPPSVDDLTKQSIPAGREGASSNNARLTRGEYFRVLEETDGVMTIDFNGNLPDLKNKRDKLASPQATYKVPSEQVASIRIVDVVGSSEKVASWSKGKANYEEDLFGRSFSNLRVPASAELRFGCGETTILTRKDANNQGIKAEFNSSAGGSLWAWLKASLSLSASISADTSSTVDSSFTEKSILRGTLFPIEYRNSGGEDEFFWAGLVQTCHSSPNWHTITVRFDKQDDYLHTEMAQLTDEGKEPLAFVNSTQPKLDKIDPGGNPFNKIQGIYYPKCFRQAFQFESLATEAMAKSPPYRVRAAIAIVTSPQLGTTDLKSFYRDSGCIGTK